MVELDVLADILLTLEVKDILSCKSVCKSWYSFISSPFFVNLHLDFIRNNDDKSSKQLGNRRIYKGRCNMSNIEGSSNGLVCISSSFYSKICLSNPSTRQFRILQDPIILPNSNNGYPVSRCYGFGYDSSTDDYKLVSLINQGSYVSLVHILSLKSNVWKLFGHVNYGSDEAEPGILYNGALHWFWFDDNGYPVSQCYGFGYDSSTDDYKLVFLINQGSYVSLVQILSLKSNLWKLFGLVNYRFHDNEPGILFNGALHWFWFDDANYTEKKVIVSFDLAKEEFREIPIPEDWRYDANYITRLGIFEDHLCMFNVCPGGRPSDIWVMRNYNVKQSWELLPNYCKMKDRVHYMKDDLSREIPSYYCCDALFSSGGRHMSAHIFLQTLVSPYFNDNERPSVAKNNERTATSTSGKEKRRLTTQEIEGE